MSTSALSTEHENARARYEPVSSLRLSAVLDNANSPFDPPPAPTQATHLQETLSKIQAIANDDVEMQPPPSEWGVYMIVDTNILLHFYEALRTFVEDVEKTKVPVVVVFPGIVVQELDRQKNGQNMAWPARRASGWLLEKVRLHKGVRVQATEETCKPSKNWRTRMKDDLAIPDDMMNDHLIIDCAQHFQAKHGNTILCSADQNLCIIAHSQGLPIMTPPQRTVWTSRDIALNLYGAEFPYLSGFSSSNAAYRETAKRGGNTGRWASIHTRELPRLSSNVLKHDVYPWSGAPSASGSTSEDEASDAMMIDDEDDGDSLSTEETPLNVLHDDVRDYFTRLLLQLVSKVGGAEVQKSGDPLMQSQHAPEYLKKVFTAWNASDCLLFLYDKSRSLKGRMLSPAPEVFLSKRYTAQGARNGWEWSPADWRVALENLVRVGAVFGDSSLEESVNDLKPYVGTVLQTARR